MCSTVCMRVCVPHRFGHGHARRRLGSCQDLTRVGGRRAYGGHTRAGSNPHSQIVGCWQIGRSGLVVRVGAAGGWAVWLGSVGWKGRKRPSAPPSTRHTPAVPATQTPEPRQALLRCAAFLKSLSKHIQFYRVLHKDDLCSSTPWRRLPAPPTPSSAAQAAPLEGSCGVSGWHIHTGRRVRKMHTHTEERMSRHGHSFGPAASPSLPKTLARAHALQCVSGVCMPVFVRVCVEHTHVRAAPRIHLARGREGGVPPDALREVEERLAWGTPRPHTHTHKHLCNGSATCVYVRMRVCVRVHVCDVDTHVPTAKGRTQTRRMSAQEEAHRDVCPGSSKSRALGIYIAKLVSP